MLLMQISSAQGPDECEFAALKTLESMKLDAARSGLKVIEMEIHPSKAGIKSALIEVSSLDEADPSLAVAWSRAWRGTIQWTFESHLRVGHRRKNWFVGVECLAVAKEIPRDGSIEFKTCRASGAGGQHVNKTDSAVHAVHLATGIAVKVMSERSQHANKRLAVALIGQKLDQLQEGQNNDAKAHRNKHHWSVDRGNPVKVFKL